MKTKFYFLPVLLIFVFTNGMAQYSIPSYGIDIIQNSYFQEQKTEGLNPLIVLAKRQINVHTIVQTEQLDHSIATVYIYSLDRNDIYGPYYMENDQTLQLDIDDRLWGALVEVESEITVDVWIE